MGVARRAWRRLRPVRSGRAVAKKDLVVSDAHDQIKARNFEVPGCGGFLLTGRAKEKPQGRRKFSWRWAAVIAWLLAAMLTLYGVDKAESGRLTNALGNMREQTSRQGGLARRVALHLPGWHEHPAHADLHWIGPGEPPIWF